MMTFYKNKNIFIKNKKTDTAESSSSSSSRLL
jgi:hypothetical protein